jgi:hypothetical protein
VQILSRHITVINCIQNFIQHSSLRVNSVCRQKYCRSSLASTNQTSYWSWMLYLSKLYFRKNQLFIDFREVEKEILYYVFTVFGIPMDLGRLIQMCWNETYGTIHIDIHLIKFLFRMECKKELPYHHCFPTML